jgi:hypothetical protein
MTFQKPDQGRLAMLYDMTPEEAIRTWVEGAFTIGEDHVLAEVVKQGLSLRMSEPQIMDVVSECIVEELGAKECMKRLASADQ